MHFINSIIVCYLIINLVFGWLFLSAFGSDLKRIHNTLTNGEYIFIKFVLFPLAYLFSGIPMLILYIFRKIGETKKVDSILEWLKEERVNK